MPTCVSWDKGRAAIYILRKKFGVNWSGQGLIREINRSRWVDLDKNILPTFSSLISWFYYYQEFRSDPLLVVIFQGKGDICWGWCHRWGCNESIEGKFPKDIAVFYDLFKLLYINTYLTKNLLKGMAMTFRIVDSHSSPWTKTCAEKRLPSTDSVVTLLKWIERHMSTRNIQQPGFRWQTFTAEIFCNTSICIIIYRILIEMSIR